MHDQAVHQTTLGTVPLGTEWLLLLLVVIAVTAVVSRSWSAPIIAAVVYTTVYAGPSFGRPRRR